MLSFLPINFSVEQNGSLDISLEKKAGKTFRNFQNVIK